MVMRKLSCWILLAGSLVWGLGCGGSKPTQSASEVTTDKPTEKPAAVSPAESKPASLPPIEKDSAAAAVLTTLKGLEAGKLAEAYDFLPASYQADLDQLLHDFAGTMDPEVWSRLTGTARKTIAFLKSKKSSCSNWTCFGIVPRQNRIDNIGIPHCRCWKRSSKTMQVTWQS